MTEKPNIVIVGGGGCGAQIARKLSTMLKPEKYNLLLITARPYYTHLPAWIRMVTNQESGLEDRAHFTYNYTFVNGNGQFIIGKVASITTEEGDKEGYVTLESGETVPYSVLILTPGSVWEGPLNIPDTKKDTMDHLREWRQKFKDANDIVLVGGGAVALEFAGEVKDVAPSKRVTIVHGQDLLLNDAYPKNFRKNVANAIQKRGVEVILNDWVDDLDIIDPGLITTRSGRKLVSDLVVPCRGAKPNTNFVTLAPGTLSETNHVRVASTLQVMKYPRIFAGGDVIEWDEQKQVTKYDTHASIIAANVVSVLKKKQPGALYQGCFEMIAVSNGKQKGSSYWSVFWGPTFGDYISATMKSKDLFLTWTRKSLGLSS
ncbi:FAD/NAD(P)-binding domain-containing protein [Agrocybe pediades]|nr:FAD/NAD(P)-binding domain-containing protein [Agrocybe pediades]